MSIRARGRVAGLGSLSGTRARDRRLAGQHEARSAEGHLNAEIAWSLRIAEDQAADARSAWIAIRTDHSRHDGIPQHAAAVPEARTTGGFVAVHGHEPIGSCG
ncbi:hypothetical protein GCM10010492_50340 [Saccharothrix mutabilis subsp. mutabilis]|uniref:Uncharacterized protein n=1 Tax=Saccharothrix mutabilis subsp. mutabilis TaxID=66855 RepID=A0ABN0UBD8_9PSEU